jgi:hypothetical protein
MGAGRVWTVPTAEVAMLWLVLIAALLSSGCELVGDIFQAGMWVGVIMVAVVVGLILLVVSKARG